MESWKQGLKGITVYRDGSRSGVLVSADDKKENNNKEYEITDTNALSRPKKLDAKVVRFQNNKEKWIAVVGLMNGRPYEIFTGKTEDVFVVPQAVEYGWVIKTKKEDGIIRAVKLLTFKSIFRQGLIYNAYKVMK